MVSAGVLDVAFLNFAVDIAVGDKPVGPVYEITFSYLISFPNSYDYWLE